MERGAILVSASRGVGASPRSAPSHSNRHLFVESLPAYGRFRVTSLQHRSEKPSRHTLSRPMDAIIAPLPSKKVAHSAETCVNFTVADVLASPSGVFGLVVAGGTRVSDSVRDSHWWRKHVMRSKVCECSSPATLRGRSFVVLFPADLSKVGVRRFSRPAMFSGTDF